MSRELVIWCERHKDRRAQPVVIDIDDYAVSIDLCSECQEPLRELMALGQPRTPVNTGEVPKFDKTLTRRIRNAPPSLVSPEALY